MAGRGPHVLHVVGAHALLRCGGAGRRALALAQEDGLELEHAGDSEEDRGVLRDQGRRGEALVALVLVELQEAGADLRPRQGGRGARRTRRGLVGGDRRGGRGEETQEGARRPDRGGACASGGGGRGRQGGSGPGQGRGRGAPRATDSLAGGRPFQHRAAARPGRMENSRVTCDVTVNQRAKDRQRAATVAGEVWGSPATRRQGGAGGRAHRSSAPWGRRSGAKRLDQGRRTGEGPSRGPRRPAGADGWGPSEWSASSKPSALEQREDLPCTELAVFTFSPDLRTSGTRGAGEGEAPGPWSSRG